MTHVTEGDVPEHINPRDISAMDDAALDAMLDEIRARRLKSLAVYEAAKAAAQQTKDHKAGVMLLTQCELCEANIARVDKALDALETRVNKIRALRLQLGV